MREISIFKNDIVINRISQNAGLYLLILFKGNTANYCPHIYRDPKYYMTKYRLKYNES